MPEDDIRDDKSLRKALDEQLQTPKGLKPSRERALAIAKLQESIMWLGMDLKRIRDESGVGGNPYPQSYNPDSPAIGPTSGDLKL